MIKERFISKFSLLLVVRNLAFGARHINLINLAQKQGRFCVYFTAYMANLAFDIKALYKLIAFKAG